MRGADWSLGGSGDQKKVNKEEVSPVLGVPSRCWCRQVLYTVLLGMAGWVARAYAGSGRMLG